jgi:hypothetical protein
MDIPKGGIMKKLWLLFFFLVLLILICPLAHPQEISGTYSVDRDEAQVTKLLGLLTAKEDPEANMLKAIKCFFGEGVLYDSKLADLLIFIDKTKRGATQINSDGFLRKDDSVRYALFKKGKKRRDLSGEKFVYIMVFIAEKVGDNFSVNNQIHLKKSSRTKKIEYPNSEEQKTTEEIKEEFSEGPPLSVWQSSLDYKVGSGEFFLISMVKAVLKAVSGSPSIENASKDEKPQEVRDEPLEMTCVGTAKDNVSLYWGYLRVPLVENTINRFTVTEAVVDQDGSKKKTIRHQATFGNYANSRIGSSVGFMGTLIPAKQREQFDDKRFPLNAFFFGNLYIKRPRLPTPHILDTDRMKLTESRFSLSLALGTALKTSLLDDLFIGVGIGHLAGSIGIVAGYNFRTEEKEIPATEQKTRTEKKRKGHFCIGISFSL